MLKVTVLGSGASGGVPLIGCNCAVCTSGKPKNYRTRVSIVVQSATTTLLVDTSPDLREQALRQNITRIDALLYTHAHADHFHGIDDVRCFNYAKDAPIPTYLDVQMLDNIQKRFDYVLLPGKPAGLMWYRPALVPHIIAPYQPFMVGDIAVMPILQQHGQGTSIGFRIGKFAYSPDTNGLSEQAMDALAGVDTWLVDCLRYLPAPTHAHLDMTLGWIEKIKPRKAYLTHLNHEFDYDELAAKLPAGVDPAYDGLRFEV